MALWLQEMYLCLKFSPKVAQLLVNEQGLERPYQLCVLTNKTVNDICNVWKPHGKNANRMPDRGHQVSVIAQENLEQAAFLFHHMRHCTFDGEVKGMWEDSVHQLSSQKKLEYYHKDSDMLPKVNKANMAGTLKTIGEFLGHFMVSYELLLHISLGKP